jgi:myo-inositol-1(or 4)-monophosphatase
VEENRTSSLSLELLAEIEALAVELAHRAGAQIMDTLGSTITVEYKREDTRSGGAPTNPVSEVDHAVEAMIREAVSARFPDHGIIGEEVEIHPDPSLEFLWVIDPVDGTTNFVNGYPLFAACIGVLQHGLPVAGAIWCATSHQLRAGVYHAHRGGPLLFEGEPVQASRPSSGVRRRLVARPGGAPPRLAQWDTRVTGSTAIECAFVSSGIFAAATFWGPFVWDVAAGVVLIEAAGLEVWTLQDREWRRFERFEVPARVREDRPPTLRDWRQALAIGTPEGVAPTLRERRNRWWRMRARIRRNIMRFL